MTVSTDIKVVDNVFVKMMHLYFIGNKVQGHAHTFDHITLLAKGKVVMRVEGGEGVEHASPKLIVTPKGIVHEFEALTPDCLLCCVHAIRDGDTEADIAPPNITEEQAQQLMLQFPLIQTA
jgi:dTDP-4-dehydrorhamnose 3,5-epimerase-like enzyme